MKELFYFIGLVFASIQMFQLSHLNSWTKKLTNILIWTKENKANEKHYDWDDLPDGMIFICIYMSLFLTWLGIGLLTYNWEFFSLYLVFWSFGSIFSSKSTEFTAWKVVYGAMWKVVGICFFVFVALNSFHLHIELGLKEYIIGLF